MAKRKSISKKTRFEVFKRDGFRCQYCGNCPPSVLLEVDHIEPVSLGGTSDIDNLLTSCFDCNRGKGAEKLNVCPGPLADRIKFVKEKQLQLKEYRKLLKQKRTTEDTDISKLEEVFSSYFDGYGFNDRFKRSVRRILQHLLIEDMMDYMDMAVNKGLPMEDTLRYFCGICWNNIKRNNS